MPAHYANRIVSKGELVLLSAGEYEDVYVAGLYRAQADLDLDDLTSRYAATIEGGREKFDAPELPPVAFGSDPRTSDPIERGFITWLGEQGLIGRIPTVEVDLKGGFYVDDSAFLTARVDNAPLLPREDEEISGPSV